MKTRPYLPRRARSRNQGRPTARPAGSSNTFHFHEFGGERKGCRKKEVDGGHQRGERGRGRRNKERQITRRYHHHVERRWSARAFVPIFFAPFFLGVEKVIQAAMDGGSRKKGLHTTPFGNPPVLCHLPVPCRWNFSGQLTQDNPHRSRSDCAVAGFARGGGKKGCSIQPLQCSLFASESL